MNHGIVGPIEAVHNIQKYLMTTSDKVPEEMKQLLINNAIPQPTIPNFIAIVEYCYEHEEEAPEELRELVAQIATMLSYHNLYGYRENGRGDAITMQLRKANGVKNIYDNPIRLKAQTLFVCLKPSAIRR